MCCCFEEEKQGQNIRLVFSNKIWIVWVCLYCFREKYLLKAIKGRILTARSYVSSKYSSGEDRESLRGRNFDSYMRVKTELMLRDRTSQFIVWLISIQYYRLNWNDTFSLSQCTGEENWVDNRTIYVGHREPPPGAEAYIPQRYPDNRIVSSKVLHFFLVMLCN